MLLLRRTRWLTIGELLAPVLIMAVFGILDASLKYSPPSPTTAPFTVLTDSDGALQCLVFDNEDGRYGYRKPIPGAWCVPLLYAPSTSSEVVDIMTTVARRNGYDAPTLFADGSGADVGLEDSFPAACSNTNGERCMLGFANTAALKTWVRNNPGRAGAAVVFGDTMERTDAAGNDYIEQEIVDALPTDEIKYEIWFNVTAIRYNMYADAGIDRLAAYAQGQSSSADTRLKDTSFMLITQRMVDEAILVKRAVEAGRSADDVSMQVALTPYPRLRDPRQMNIGGRIVRAAGHETVKAPHGPTFINLAFTIPAIILIIRVVREKERHVTGAMRSTGLLDSAYWVSYWGQGIFVALVVTTLTYITGLAFSIEVMVNTSGSVVWTFLFMYELAWFAIAFLISSCFHQVQWAVIVSVLFLLLTLFFSAFSFFPIANYIWWEKKFPLGGGNLASVLGILMPWFDTLKFLADATEVTTTTAILNETTGINEVQMGGQFGWNELYNYTVNRSAFLTYDQVNDEREYSWFVAPTPGESFNLLFVCFALYFFWAWYLSQVLTGGESRPQPFYFPINPRYWVTYKDGGKSTRTLLTSLRARTEQMVDGLDEDVAKEMEAVHKEELPENTTVRILGLEKTYSRGIQSIFGFKRFGWKFTAVKGVSYAIQRGKLFALLGHNGAGKTTTIKMMTAQSKPTQGDTTINGLSVRNDAEKIRKFLGICPQHDILYDELTSVEHLWLYGALKGISRATLAKDIPRLLEHVKLERVKHKGAGTYSGGMKRRLSVAVSFIGDPQVVMLDEPTTGMDPMNRKHVWDMIAELKTTRSVLLTTHSMEEADALGDRIGIMSAGQLVALGNSLHLKEKFGDGYTVKIVAPQVSTKPLKARIEMTLPTAHLADENAGNMTYILGDTATINQAPKLISLIESVQAGEESGLELTDWGVSHTTLEDVFLKLAKHGGVQSTEKLKLNISIGKQDWSPGNALKYGAPDGLEYTLPSAAMPDEGKWNRLCSEQNGDLVDFSLKVDKLPRDPVLGKKLAGSTKVIKIKKTSLADKLGLVLANDAGPVEVMAVNEEGMCHPQVKVGDTILAINGLEANGHGESTERLKSALGTLTLHIKKEIVATSDAAGSATAKRYYLSALRSRSLLIASRQCFCKICPCLLMAIILPSVFMGFLIGYDRAVLTTAIGRNSDLINQIVAGVDFGCRNATAMMTEMCEQRTDTASTETYSSCDFCPNEIGFICSFWRDADTDQCASSFGAPAGSRESGAFGTNCTVGPGQRYEYESLLPSFCNCTSPEFQQFVDGTWACNFDSLFSRLFLQDQDPLTVVRRMNASRDGLYYDYGFASGIIADSWSQYASWRIPVIAPAGIGMGTMTGYLRDNGWIGSYNQSYDASAATKDAVDAAVTTTGLLNHFPSGRAYTDPAVSVGAQGALTPAFYLSAAWESQQACMASSNMTTCCFDVTRDTTTNPYPSCPSSEIGCQDEDALAVSTRLCAPCDEFYVRPVSGDWIVSTDFTEAGARTPQQDTRNVRYVIDIDSIISYCQGHQCMASMCEMDSESRWRNPKCSGVRSSMIARCENVTQQVIDACVAGEQWVHPADSTLLMLKWAKWLGRRVFLPNVDLTVSPQLATAFTATTARAMMNNVSQLWVPDANCVPPFCFDFRAAPPATSEPLAVDPSSGASGPSTSMVCDATGLADVLATLDLVYPCSAAYPDQYTHGGVAYNSSVAFSTAERGLCTAAYEIMSIIYTVGSGYGDFTAVPECSPDGLDMLNGFHLSCGTCEPTICPVHEHFATPMYAEAETLLGISQEVLANQQAILCREQGTGTCPDMPSPTLPLANVPSTELDKLFPSTSLHFKALDLSALSVDFEITSFWGDKAEWPFLVAPTDWALSAAQTAGSYRDDFTMIKFPTGQLSWINDRIVYTGGFSSMMTNWVTNALLKAGIDPGLSVTTAMKPFPFRLSLDIIEDDQQAASGVREVWTMLIDLVTPQGCTVLTLYFLTLQVVQEKEHRLRAIMVMMGLNMRYYWLWEWMFNSLITLSAFSLFWGVGMGAGIKFITRSAMTSLVMMLLWSQLLVMLAQFYSCFFSKQLWATIILIVAMIVLGLFSFVMNQFILFRSTDEWPPVLFLLFPPLAFFRGINLLAKRTYTFDYIEGEMATVLFYMAINIPIYFFLAQYLDLVLPREFGVTRSPLFCLDSILPKRAVEGVPPDTDEDEDVASERKAVEDGIKLRATSSTSPHKVTNPIETLSLRKVYKGGKVAVRNLTFSVHDDECFGLLGPNGAGKTTTISMLTGLYPPSAGNAYVCGHDIKTQMTKIYEAMGVCPQFDILWPLLTVKETLRFYCKLKGVKPSEWRETSETATQSVDLGHAAHRRVGRLSGGMKRRVSLAISLIGEPAVVFLDEPTTGLDPETKRAMWTLIDLSKAGRAIVLTTHSMEEADALCGRIGIMAYGRMRCLGSSLHLKDKFGEGYKIVATYKEGKSGSASRFVTGAIPGAKMIGDFNNTATFMIPSGSVRLSSVFETMKAPPDEAGILDWALRQTSMEEVFLKVALASEIDHTRELDEAAATKTGKGAAGVEA